MHATAEIAPPREQWIAGSYSVLDAPQIMRTCARGCCAHKSGFTMYLPRYWRLATPDEAAREKAADAGIKPMDLSSLWEDASPKETTP